MGARDTTIENQGRRRDNVGTINNIKDIAPDKHVSKVYDLLYELNDHKIQIEMKNAELHRVQREFDRFYKSYKNIYEHAPVSYFILEAGGNFIINVNKAAGNLLQLNYDSSVMTDSNINYIITIRSPEGAESSDTC